MDVPQPTIGVPEQAGRDGAHGPALELRVHGVGGATPQEMLNDPCVTRITGDDTAAVYRRTGDVDAEEHPGTRSDRVTEAYCWSHLTSGNGLRALWLLLLPFMIVNLAHWMLPGTGGRATARLYGVLVRLLALSLTVLLVAAACEVALDLVAWQCAGSPQCAGEHSWLSFAARSPGGTGGWWSLPGRRLALAAAVPLALVALLWWLSHHTWSAYESQPPPQTPQAGRDGTPVPALSLPGFWYGRRLVARLRAAHTAAGLLTVAGALTCATGRPDRAPGGDGVPAVLGHLLQGLVVLCALAVVWTVCRRGRSEHRADRGEDRITRLGLPAAAAGLLAAVLVHTAWFRPGWRNAGPLPADTAFGVLTVVQGGLVAGIAVLGALGCRGASGRGTVLRGLGGAAAAMQACFLGGVLSGGVAQRVADWLDRGATPGSGSGPLHGPPTLLTWQAAAIPVVLAMLSLVGCLFLLRVRRRTRVLAPAVCDRYPDAVPLASRSRQIAGAVARAELTDSAPMLLGALSLTALVLGLTGVLGTWLTGHTPARAADGAPALVDGFADTVQALGSWLIGLAVLLFLALGRRAYRDVSARRTVGILWDVGTFWPRAAHPFAPPCYAERAVPDLVWRMVAWTERLPGGRLVISGHSQGSVLAAAAVWQLDAQTRRQIALLTYGSPLARLYGRWFPRYFGPGQLAGLHGELDCWRNLWRGTDPIGGPVGPPGVDRGPLLDPLAYRRTLRRPLPTPVLAHGDYQADPVFGQERDGLLTRLRPCGGRPLRRDRAGRRRRGG